MKFKSLLSYLFVGLLSLSVLTGCGNGGDDTPSPSPTTTPSPSPTETSTPSPSPTATLTPSSIATPSPTEEPTPSSTGVEPSSSIPINNNKIKVKLDVKDLDIKLDDNYNIVTEEKSIPISSSTPINIEVTKKDITPVILSNKYGEPILYTLAKEDDTQIDITIETTAIVFTIKTSRFFGLKITDYNTLSERIKSHTKFSKLVSELKYYINTSSPCPTDHSCNLVASDVAMQIANEIKISDITEKVE